MKRSTIAFALVVATALSTPSLARDMVFGFSSQQTPEVLKKQAEQAIAHMLGHLEPNETARFFDASKVKLVATFKAPEGKHAKIPKVFLNANPKALAGLKKFIKSAEAVPGRVSGVDMPAMFATLRQNYQTEDGADLIILGSPIHDDPKAPSLSMIGGRVPNDGHIAANVSESPYGTSGLSGSLKGYDVYIGFDGFDWVVSNAHRYQVKRFWSLSVEAHGGSLAYFGDDLATLFETAGTDVPDIKHSQPLEATDKKEMLLFERDTGKIAQVYDARPEPHPAPEPVWRRAVNPRIGVSWTAPKADLDLFVRPTPSSPVIYFGQASTEEGQLYKDFRNSPVNGFETVALNGTYDLSDTLLAINLYGGKVPVGGVSGEIRIAIDDEVWAKSFTIAAKQGNKGKGAESVMRDGQVPNKAWIIIKPTDILTGK
ncbi:hypothetical protein SAMN04488056_105252 [Cohaesibacter marisflavi]|uniref:Uncharacterized protein n=1 Tax=Cohaesibacter marisflavi TaxID=655353 RepID=A0A1I5GXU3_9HYPH|nr:hypothetical protein [Cohaesibacter marisflavi]SFO40822.1 hypothetical protein SAMN04488056_105252 [Cohaesibacter marisflavi]